MALGGEEGVRAREVLHELRNALGLVITYTSLVKGQLGDHQEALEDVEEIRKAGERAAELLGDLSMLLGPRPG